MKNRSINNKCEEHVRKERNLKVKSKGNQKALLNIKAFQFQMVHAKIMRNVVIVVVERV